MNKKSMANHNPTSSLAQGQRVFTCGHSFHVWVADILIDMAKGAGISGHHAVGMSSIGGSRVIEHWDVPEEQNEAKKALRAGNVDVLTLSPIWLPDEGMAKFASLALQHNPNVRVTVQEYWLPNDVYEPVYPLQAWKQVDHNIATIPELRKQHDLYFHDMDETVRGLNRQLGKNVVLIVPAGQAALALREMIIAGKTPGLNAQADLFTDSWGHPTPPLQALAAYCHFATIYRRSPRGLPLPSVLASNPSWGAPLNRILQQLAWKAVTEHPLSGVGASLSSKGRVDPNG
ncbi:MAG TPA: SGNH/GDSL hydrolase family protein [Tepidisphaeraceae bacterium]|jgi:hypothetical protein